MTSTWLLVSFVLDDAQGFALEHDGAFHTYATDAGRRMPVFTTRDAALAFARQVDGTVTDLRPEAHYELSWASADDAWTFLDDVAHALELPLGHARDEGAFDAAIARLRTVIVWL